MSLDANCVARNPVSFFTAVESKKYPILSAIDHYFWFGGRVAQQIIPEEIKQGRIAAVKIDREKSDLITALKVASMILSLGVLPLLALALKVVLRSYYHFHFIEQPKCPHDLAMSLLTIVPERITHPSNHCLTSRPLATSATQLELDEAIALNLIEEERPIAASNGQAPQFEIGVPGPGGNEGPLDLNLILPHIPVFLEGLNQLNNALEQAILTRSPSEQLLRQQEWIIACLNQLSIADLASHYAQLRMAKSLEAGLQLQTVSPAELIDYYQNHISPNREGLHSLRGVALLIQLEYLFERELELARSSFYRAERELIQQEHHESDLEEAAAAIIPEVERASQELLAENNSATIASFGEPAKPQEVRPTFDEIRRLRVEALTRKS